jgi:hypothetical protein
VPQRVSIRLHFSPSAWSVAACNLAWLLAQVASLHDRSSLEKLGIKN